MDTKGGSKLTKLNVLVTATGSAISLGIIKSLKLSSLKCNIIGTDNQEYAAGLYRCNSSYIIPKPDTRPFADKIIDICNKEAIDVILIGTDYELRRFSTDRKYIEKHTGAKIIVSKTDTIDICNNKWLTYIFLKMNKLPYIPTITEEDYNIHKMTFPLLIKPCIGDSSKGVQIVNTQEELENKLSEKVENKYLNTQSKMIIQKLVSGPEYTTTTITLDGKCAGVLTLEKEMRFGGHTTKAIVMNDKSIDKQIAKIAETLSPMGPANFQFKIENGIPMIFEINCRFSGTTPFCSMIGFNTVEATLRYYILKEPIQELKKQDGTFLRYFNEVFIPKKYIESMKKNGYVDNPISYTNPGL